MNRNENLHQVRTKYCETIVDYGGEKTEHIIKFRPAYDKRHFDPKKNCGIHGVEILFLVKGKEGAVQFLLFTNWHLPHVQKEIDSKQNLQFPYLHHKPMPADLGYHSRTQKFDNQVPITETCEYLEGSPCYYDGSGLAAERIFDVLCKEGDVGVWRELETYYKETFQILEENSESETDN